MELRLTDAEAQLLLQVLRQHLGDLRMEIRDTDSYDFRQGLKADEDVLRARLSSASKLAPLPSA